MIQILQALAMAINISRQIADLAKQAQGANGSRLAEITNAINLLTAQGLGMMDIVRNMIEADRHELSPEEEQAIKDADNAARDAQQRVLAAMNDESGDPVAQQKNRDSARQKAREDQKGEPSEFQSARKAGEERGKSR